MAAKLRRLIELLEHELSVRRLEQEVTSRTQQRMTKQQREHLLREQLRSIQSELGEEGEGGSETAELRKRVEQTPLSPEARREAERELQRLEQIPADLAGVRHRSRSYLDWLLALPWGKETGGTIDIARARAILDEDHYDLEKIKERILDYLAVRKLRQERHAPVSLDGAGTPARAPEARRRADPLLRRAARCGQDLAGAVDRAGDGAEFVAHQPGRHARRGGDPRAPADVRRRAARPAHPGAEAGGDDAIRCSCSTRSTSWASSFHGDPAAALLEVLDPAQNHTFVDTYLGVPFDLSKILFICTANTVETIPPPLLDRMEVLALSGYTEAEKLHIARRYLLPKQIARPRAARRPSWRSTTGRSGGSSATTRARRACGSWSASWRRWCARRRGGSARASPDRSG